MATMDAQQIYDNFHSLARGTQGLAAAAQTAQELAGKYLGRAQTTQLMIDTLQSGWRGASAEAASQGLAPMAENAFNSHQQLGTGQDIVSRQVDSFHTAASQVQPVPAAPSMNDVIGAVIAGQNPVPILDQMANHHAVQQANVDAYNRYVGASQYNTANLPPLTTIDDSGAPVSVTRPATAQATASPLSTRMSQGSPTHGVRQSDTAVVGHTSRSSTGTAPHGGTGVSAVPTPSHVLGNSGATTTTSSVAAPSAAPTGPGIGSNPAGNRPTNPIGPTSGGLPPVDRGFPVGGGFPPVGGGQSPVGRGWSGTGARSGSGAPLRDGAGPVRGGAGALGEPESGVGGPRSAGGQPLVGRPGARAGGVSGEGGRSGAVAGSAEEEVLAAERGVAGRAGGTPLAGPMGGSRRRSEDAEHKRRYGIPEDGELRFGIDDLYAPPVIGETADEREQRDAQERARHGRDH